MRLTENLRQDLPASIVVFFVAVPLCLGIALASGAPLFSGLIAGIIGGIVVGMISGSNLGVSGPAAGLAVIVLSAIDEMGFEVFLVAVVLSGLIQIGFGLARGGFIAYFFPSSVIRGMLAGIGIIIIMKQIPHAFGHDTIPEGQLEFLQPDGNTTLSSFTVMMVDYHVGAMIVSAVSLFILLFWEHVLAKRSKVFQLIQGPLVVVAFGILYQLIASKVAPAIALDDTHLVNVPVAQSLSQLGDLFVFPQWSEMFSSSVLITAATLAVVASLETLLCVEATDKLDPLKRTTPTNRELVAQGAGNTLSGLVGGLPITQVIVRSSANIQSNARSKLSAILHGVFLLIFALALPQLLNMIPLAVLASILFVVGYKLAKPALFMEIYRAGNEQFIPFIATILGIVFTDLLVGISIGLFFAIFMILRRNFINAFEFQIEDHEESDHTHTITIDLAEEVSFFSRASMVDHLGKVPDGSRVVIDGTNNRHIDPDVVEAIDDFRVSAKHRNISVECLGENFLLTTAPAS